VEYKVKNKGIVSDTWLTPADFYDRTMSWYDLDTGFDPCPPECDIEEFDGLKADWSVRTFCNPPYSRKLKELFILKALKESRLGKLVVLLLPVSTGSAIFHEVIQPRGGVKFLKGRLMFEGIDAKDTPARAKRQHVGNV
jgi:hypothetical protein